MDSSVPSGGEILRSLEHDEDELNEPMVARVVVDIASQHDAALVVGSSMPVRDVEWWAGTRRSATFSNRGVNGIDGVVSTVFGVCAGSNGIGLVGDLTMLHDVSGLVDGLGPNGGRACSSSMTTAVGDILLSSPSSGRT